MNKRLHISIDSIEFLLIVICIWIHGAFVGKMAEVLGISIAITFTIITLLFILFNRYGNYIIAYIGLKCPLMFLYEYDENIDWFINNLIDTVGKCNKFYTFLHKDSIVFQIENETGDDYDFYYVNTSTKFEGYATTITKNFDKENPIFDRVRPSILTMYRLYKLEKSFISK